MVLSHLATVQRLAVLVQLTIPGLGVQRYQNWCREPYLYQNEEYFFVDFDGASLASRRLDFANSESTIEVGNRSARHDSLRPVREWLRSYDGWRRAEVEVTFLWPDDPTAIPQRNRLRILSSSLQGGKASLSLRSPIEAVNAVVPSAHATRQNVPELPYRESGS